MVSTSLMGGFTLRTLMLTRGKEHFKTSFPPQNILAMGISLQPLFVMFYFCIFFLLLKAVVKY